MRTYVTYCRQDSPNTCLNLLIIINIIIIINAGRR
jgi:hypothetical protein